MSIHLHIEELLLEGIALGANGARDFERAVQARLAELLTTPLAAHDAAVSAITVPLHIDPTAFGTTLAESVHAALPGIASGESP